MHDSLGLFTVGGCIGLSHSFMHNNIIMSFSKAAKLYQSTQL